MTRHPASGADVYRSADRLLRRHGGDAVVVAEMRASEFLGRGDMDGYRTWKRIVLVVDTLFSSAPPKGSVLH